MPLTQPISAIRLARFAKLKKNAMNIHHFFHMVIDDLTITKNTTYTPDKCKIPSGHLVYDGLTVKSYGVRILYMNRDKIVLDAYSMPEDTPLKLRSKIQKHFDEVLRILDLDNIQYDLDIFDDEEDENPKRYWLLRKTKSTVVNIKDTCCIDLEEYDELIKTECGHLFCDKNLYSWLNEHDNKTCPLCRTKLL